MAFTRETAIANRGKGRPKGSLAPQTKLRIKIKSEVDTMILKNAHKILRAWMIPAMGQHFIYRIDEEKNSDGKVLSRKHVLVTDKDEIAKALDAIQEGGEDPEENFYYVTAKEPDWRAGMELLNRGLPKEEKNVMEDFAKTLRDLALQALERNKPQEPLHKDAIEVNPKLNDGQ